MSVGPKTNFIELTVGNTVVFQGRVREDRTAEQLEASFLELVDLLTTTYRADREPRIRLQIIPL